MTRIRWKALLPALLLALLLAACQDGKNVSGVLEEIQTDDDGNLTAFVLKPAGSNKSVGVKMAEGTKVWPVGEGSWPSQEAVMADFLEDFQVGCQVSAWCYSRREKLETAEGERVPAYWAQIVDITGILEREAVTLRDGTALDMLEDPHFHDRTYRLADGTELLRVNDGGGPENRYVMGRESFDDLSETAKEKVRAYYEEQGLLYDEREELEKAYAAWKELGEDFACPLVGQDVTPAASSERIMYFTTSVTLPAEYDESVVTGLELCDAFDRETGERIDIPDLFAVPWEEVRRRLPELAGWRIDPAVAAEMAEALEPEWICFGQSELSVLFPAGSLPSNVIGQEGPPEEWKEPQAAGYHFSLDWQSIPEGFLQPWAIPKAPEDSGGAG